MTSTAHNDLAPGCERLTAAAVAQLDAMARDRNAVHALWVTFEYAMNDVHNQLKEADTICPDSFETHLWRLLQLARLVGVLESPGTVGRQPHIVPPRGCPVVMGRKK